MNNNQPPLDRVVYVPVSVKDELPNDTKTKFIITDKGIMDTGHYSKDYWQCVDIENDGNPVIYLKPVPLSELIEEYLKNNCQDNTIDWSKILPHTFTPLI